MYLVLSSSLSCVFFCLNEEFISKSLRAEIYGSRRFSNGVTLGQKFMWKAMTLTNHWCMSHKQTAETLIFDVISVQGFFGLVRCMGLMDRLTEFEFWNAKTTFAQHRAVKVNYCWQEESIKLLLFNCSRYTLPFLRNVDQSCVMQQY